MIFYGASSSGRTQDFGSCCGGSNPPAPGVGYRKENVGNREEKQGEEGILISLLFRHLGVLDF
jgi:hypothetical protein